MKKQAASRLSKRPPTTRAAVGGARLRTIVSEKDIRKRVRELARQINRDYAGKTLHVVGIQENSFVFMADLVRLLTIPVVCSFVRSQVRDHESGRGVMREIAFLPPVEAAGKNLLLVEGVLQSGITHDYLRRTLLAQQPASLRTVTLVDKAKERKVDLPSDYAAFQFSGRNLVGYGLGYQGEYRNLPFLAWMAE